MAQAAVGNTDYAPTAQVDVAGMLRERARKLDEKVLSAQRSIVDLMKVLKMDSSLGARKKLAQQWGYPDSLDGSAEMDSWLRAQAQRKIKETSGHASAGG